MYKIQYLRAFFAGRVNFSTQQTIVPVVKDPTSDIAVCARKGSVLLRDSRERRERSKMRKRFWEVGGTRIGKAMGVDGKDEGNKGEGKAYGDEEEDDVNYKADSQYSSHLKKKSEAQSQFAKTKTMKQQREFLPVYAVMFWNIHSASLFTRPYLILGSRRANECDSRKSSYHNCGRDRIRQNNPNDPIST
jgi:hypothetical protein